MEEKYVEPVRIITKMIKYGFYEYNNKEEQSYPSKSL